MKKLFSFLINFLIIPTLCFGGVDFDNTDDFISCGSPAGLDDITVYTVCATFKADTISASVDEVIAKYGSSANQGPVLMELDSTGGGRIATFWSDGGAGQLTRTAGGAITTGVWYRVCTTLDSSKNGKIYIDGVDATSTNQTGGALQSDAANNMQIGKIGISGGQRYFDGIISEVAIWGSNLSAQEILIYGKSNVKRVALQLSPSTLKAYWALDDVSDGSSVDGSTFKDLSQNALDCTGDNGANNTGLTAKAEEVASYP